QSGIAYDPGKSRQSFALTGLAEGTRYYWRVVAKSACDPGMAAASLVGDFSTLGGPEPPLLSKPANGSVDVTTSVVLDWQNLTSPGTPLYAYYVGLEHPSGLATIPWQDVHTRSE